MSTRQNRSMVQKRKAVNSAHALARPELRLPRDGIPRKPSTGAGRLMVKENDPETQRLIEEALAKRCPHDILSAG